MHKIRNEQSASIWDTVKLSDSNFNYTLSNIETDLALPWLKTKFTFLKHCFKYSGEMFCKNLLCEAKTTHLFSEFKHKLARLPSVGSCFTNNIFQLAWTYFFTQHFCLCFTWKPVFVMCGQSLLIKVYQATNNDVHVLVKLTETGFAREELGKGEREFCLNHSILKTWAILLI